MDNDQFSNSIVVDSGSSTCKAGFARDDLPRTTIPTVIGRPKQYQATLGGDPRDSYVGNEAQSKRGILSLNYPIEHGVITNWDDMETLWNHLFCKDLQVDPAAHRVLMTDSIFATNMTRKRIAEIMFETFNSPSLYVTCEGGTSLYASGNTSGLVLHSGFSHTYVLPVFEGYALSTAAVQAKVGGEDVTNYFTKLLSDHGFPILTMTRSSPERECLDKIKQKVAFVKCDEVKKTFSLPQNNESSENQEYGACYPSRCSQSTPVEDKFQLPDGSWVTVRDERHCCTELLFHTSVCSQYDGIHHMVQKALLQCDKDVHSALALHVTLAGGNSLFLGFENKLQQELNCLEPTGTYKVIAPSNRHISAWIGGTLIASLPVFDSNSMFVKKEEYNESSLQIVARKFAL